MVHISNGGEDSFGLIALSQSLNMALDQNQTAFSILILPVPLEMLASGNRFPNSMAATLRETRVSPAEAGILGSPGLSHVHCTTSWSLPGPRRFVRESGPLASL